MFDCRARLARFVCDGGEDPKTPWSVLNTASHCTVRDLGTGRECTRRACVLARSVFWHDAQPDRLCRPGDRQRPRDPESAGDLFRPARHARPSSQTRSCRGYNVLGIPRHDNAARR